MDPNLIAILSVAGVVLLGTFIYPKIQPKLPTWLGGPTAGATDPTDPLAGVKALFTTTEKAALSSMPVRSVAVTLLMHMEPVADALPNAASQVSCHAAIKTLITEIGDPTAAV